MIAIKWLNYFTTNVVYRHENKYVSPRLNNALKKQRVILGCNICIYSQFDVLCFFIHLYIC